MTITELLKTLLISIVLMYSSISVGQPLNERLDSSNQSKSQLEKLKSESDSEKVRQKDLEFVKKQGESNITQENKSYSWFEVNQKKILLTIGFLLVCFFMYKNYFKKKLVNE
jgi:hypothetical protein